MLVKISSNEKVFLVILREKSFKEFLEKARNLLGLEPTKHIKVQFVGVEIDETTFNEVIQDSLASKEVATFEVSSDIRNQKDSETREEYLDIEFLEDHSQIRENTDVVNALDPVTTSYEVIAEGSNKAGKLVVNIKIPLINFNGIYEVAKVMGLVHSGQTLEKKNRIYAAKAVIKKVLETLGFDYL